MWMWSTGINRNIVECKDAKLIQYGAKTFVLIETLWNVKYIRKAVEVIQGFVLIETLWNVKCDCTAGTTGFQKY